MFLESRGCLGNRTGTNPQVGAERDVFGTSNLCAPQRRAISALFFVLVLVYWGLIALKCRQLSNLVQQAEGYRFWSSDGWSYHQFQTSETRTVNRGVLAVSWRDMGLEEHDTTRESIGTDEAGSLGITAQRRLSFALLLAS